MQRAFTVYGDARYERLAALSVGHLYNLRRRAGYQATRLHWTKTKGQSVPIGARRAPAPDGRPGFIRIDSVHQGDQDGAKGLYHINAVDCVTQFEIVATCERLSEAYLLPALEGERSAKNYSFVDAVARKNVELTMAEIRRRSAVIAELETTGAVKIAGAMYKLETAVVDFLLSAPK